MAMRNRVQLLLSGLCAALFACASSAQETAVSVKEATAGPASPEAIVGAMVPPRAPKVSCVGSQLTISADNSTLEGVLTAVRACIGIQVDIPEAAAGSRVFEDLGPGPARQVLEALLSGTEFNYVIESSDADPQKIASITLIERSTDAPGPGVAPDRVLTPARKAWLQSRQNRRAGAPPSDESNMSPDEPPDATAPDDAAATSADNAKTNTAQAPPPDPAPPAADQPPPAPVESAAAPAVQTAPPQPVSSAGSNSSQNGSTAERITEMQQMFQQRRQMNQAQSQNQAQPQTAQQP